MLALVASMVVTFAGPSAAGLAPRFVQVQAALSGAQPTAVDPQDPYAAWTRPQLEQEWRRLDDLRPGMGLPITLLAVGAAVLVIDFVVFFFGGLIALTGGSGIPVPLTAGIVVAAIAGVGMILTGIYFIVRIGQERRDLGQQIDLIKAAIEKRNTEAAPPAPPPENTPPPPPDVPLQVRRGWAPPLVLVTVARF